MDTKFKPKYSIGDPQQCFYVGVKRFWVPVKQGNPINGSANIYHWLDDRTATRKNVLKEFKWRKYEPNGLDIEKCVEAHVNDRIEYWNDELCTSQRCSICLMPRVQKYYLRGHHRFDHQYSLTMDLQQDAPKIVFEGVGSSQIIWNSDYIGGIDMTYIKQRDSKSNSGMTLEKIFSQKPFGLLKNKSIDEDPEGSMIFTKVQTFYSFRRSLFRCCYKVQQMWRSSS